LSPVAFVRRFTSSTPTWNLSGTAGPLAGGEQFPHPPLASSARPLVAGGCGTDSAPASMRAMGCCGGGSYSPDSLYREILTKKNPWGAEDCIQPRGIYAGGMVGRELTGLTDHSLQSCPGRHVGSKDRRVCIISMSTSTSWDIPPTNSQSVPTLGGATPTTHLS
jgi:hypothetical protein